MHFHFLISSTGSKHGSRETFESQFEKTKRRQFRMAVEGTIVEYKRSFASCCIYPICLSAYTHHTWPKRTKKTSSIFVFCQYWCAYVKSIVGAKRRNRRPRANGAYLQTENIETRNRQPSHLKIVRGFRICFLFNNSIPTHFVSVSSSWR